MRDSILARAAAWTAFLFLAGSTSPEGATTLVHFGKSTEWKFADGERDPDPGWQGAAFDDSGWKHGPAPLGCNEEDAHTAAGCGGNVGPRPLTVYFRHRFEARPLARAAQLLVLLRCDDGAAIYLNGKELVRENLPGGELTHRTLAVKDFSGGDERKYRRYLVPGNPLVEGLNVLAAEVHQANADSDDLLFDMVLRGYSEDDEPRPGKVAAEAREVVMVYRQKHYVGPEMRIPDGYRDGGRGMTVDEAGNVTTGREVLAVDRSRDPVLRKHLEVARSDEVRSLKPLERARRLARYIDEQLAGGADPEDTLQAVEVFQAEYANLEVLIGEVDAGVCRHQALLFKLMADEAGLRAALVRGLYRVDDHGGGHAWNELILDDGQRLLVDVTNPRPGFQFPETTSRFGRRYFGVRGEQLYQVKTAGDPREQAVLAIAKLKKVARLPRVSPAIEDSGEEKQGRPAAGSPAGKEETKDLADIADLLKRRLEASDTVSARLQLAHAYDDLGRQEEARAQVKAALAKDPDDGMANLAEAVLALKGEEPPALARAQEHLKKAQRALAKKKPSAVELREYSTVIGLFLAFSGRLDTALDFLEAESEADPGHESARKLLEALER
jgi:hypothetical protein